MKSRQFRCGTAALLLTSIVSSSAVGAIPPSWGANFDTTDPARIAQQQAQSSGMPVEVKDLTTTMSRTVANPDGSFTLSSSATPVRANVAGSWQNIDTTLVRHSDGTITPRIVDASIEFSGGGTGPAVEYSTSAEPDKSVSLTMAQALPAPTLAGSSATYANVLPGVDLVQTAYPDSYTQVLVVHDATAAANPTLKKLSATLHADGVTVAPSPQGGLLAKDEAGQVVMTGPPPTMWDSTPGIEGTVPDATSPGDSGMSTVAMSAPVIDGTDTTAAGTVTLKPTSDQLAGSHVAYPLYIDPSVAPTESFWTVVQTNKYQYNSAQTNDRKLRVGKCTVTCAYTARTYLKFPLSGVQPRSNGTTAKVSSASLKVLQEGNQSGCDSEPSTLWPSDDISAATVWPGPQVPTAIQTVYSTGCVDNPAWVTFNSATVANQVEATAKTGGDFLTFALTATNESDANQFKWFSAQSTSPPTLTINFSYPPSTPIDLHVAGMLCNGTTYVADSTPRLYATVVNNDPSPKALRLTWSMYERLADGTVRTAIAPTLQQFTTTTNSAVNAYWDPATALTNGDYYFTVQADNSPDVLVTGAGTTLYSAKVTSPTFTVLTGAAPPPPQASSFSYPEGTSTTAPYGSPADAPGSITITSQATADAGIAYAYDSTPVPAQTLNSCTTPTNNTNASSGTIAYSGSKVLLTPPATLTAGVHTLHVRSYDSASRQGTEKTYAFNIAPASSGKTQLIETETLTPTTTGVPLVTATSKGYYTESSPRWSAGAQQHIPSNGAGNAVTYTFTTTSAGVYDIQVRHPMCTHFGKFTATLDKGTANEATFMDPASETFDLFGQSTGYSTVATFSQSDGNCSPDFVRSLGDTDAAYRNKTIQTNGPGAPSPPMSAGTHTITFTLTSPGSTTQINPETNTNDNGYSLGFDQLRISWLR